MVLDRLQNVSSNLVSAEASNTEYKADAFAAAQEEANKVAEQANETTTVTNTDAVDAAPVPVPAPPPPPNPEKEAKAAYYGLTYDGKNYQSPAGLTYAGAMRDEYGFVDPSLDRLDHILAHLSPDEFKDIHSIFPESVKFRGQTYDLRNGDLFKFLDALWAGRNTEGPPVYRHISTNRNGVSSVSYHFMVTVVDIHGQESNQFVRLATTDSDNGTVLSAFPESQEDVQKFKFDRSFRRVNPKPKPATTPAAQEVQKKQEVVVDVPQEQRVSVPETSEVLQAKAGTDTAEFAPKQDIERVRNRATSRDPSFSPAWDVEAALRSQNPYQAAAAADYYDNLIAKLPADDSRLPQLTALRDKLRDAQGRWSTDSAELTKQNIDRILQGDNLLEIEGLHERLSDKEYHVPTEKKQQIRIEIDKCIARKAELTNKLNLTPEFINQIIESGSILELQGLQRQLSLKLNYVSKDLNQTYSQSYKDELRGSIDRCIARRYELEGKIDLTPEYINKVLEGTDELEIQGLQSKLFNKKAQATPEELAVLEFDINRCMARKAELAGTIPLTQENIDKILLNTDPFVIEGLEKRLWARKKYPELVPGTNDFMQANITRCQARKAELGQVELTPELIDKIITGDDLLVIDGLHARLIYKKRGASTNSSKAAVQADIDRCIARKTELTGEKQLTPERVKQALESDNLLIIEGLQKKLEFSKAKASADDKIVIQANIDRCIDRKKELVVSIPTDQDAVTEVLNRSNLLEISGLQEILFRKKANAPIEDRQAIQVQIDRCSDKRDKISGVIEYTDESIAEILKTENIFILDGLISKLKSISRNNTNYSHYADLCQNRKYELLAKQVIALTENAIKSGSRYTIEAAIKERHFVKANIVKIKSRRGISPELSILHDNILAQEVRLSQARIRAQYAGFERSGYEDRAEARKILQEEFDAYKQSVADGTIDANSEEAKWIEEAYQAFEKDKAGNPGVKITRVRLDHLNHRLVSDLKSGLQKNNTAEVSSTLTRMESEYARLLKAVELSFKVKSNAPAKPTNVPKAPTPPAAGANTSPTPTTPPTSSADPAYVFDGRMIAPDAIEELNTMLDDPRLTDLQRMKIERLIETIEDIQLKISEMLAIPYEKPTRPAKAAEEEVAKPVEEAKPAVETAEAPKDPVRPVITREQLANRATEELFKLKDFTYMKEAEKAAIRQLILDIYLKAGARMSITSNGNSLSKIEIVTSDRTALDRVIRTARSQGSSSAFQSVMRIFTNNIYVKSNQNSADPWQQNSRNTANTPSPMPSNAQDISGLKAQMEDIQARIVEHESQKAPKSVTDPLYSQLFELDRRLDALDGEGHPAQPNFVQARKEQALKDLVEGFREQAFAAKVDAEKAASDGDEELFEQKLAEAEAAKAKADALDAQLKAGDFSAIDDNPIEMRLRTTPPPLGENIPTWTDRTEVELQNNAPERTVEKTTEVGREVLGVETITQIMPERVPLSGRHISLRSILQAKHADGFNEASLRTTLANNFGLEGSPYEAQTPFDADNPNVKIEMTKINRPEGAVDVARVTYTDGKIVNVPLDKPFPLGGWLIIDKSKRQVVVTKEQVIHQISTVQEQYIPNQGVTSEVQKSNHSQALQRAITKAGAEGDVVQRGEYIEIYTPNTKAQEGARQALNGLGVPDSDIRFESVLGSDGEPLTVVVTSVEATQQAVDVQLASEAAAIAEAKKRTELATRKMQATLEQNLDELMINGKSSLEGAKQNNDVAQAAFRAAQAIQNVEAAIASQDPDAIINALQEQDNAINDLTKKVNAIGDKVRADAATKTPAPAPTPAQNSTPSEDFVWDGSDIIGKQDGIRTALPVGTRQTGNNDGSKRGTFDWVTKGTPDKPGLDAVLRGYPNNSSLRNVSKAENMVMMGTNVANIGMIQVQIDQAKSRAEEDKKAIWDEVAYKKMSEADAKQACANIDASTEKLVSQLENQRNTQIGFTATAIGMGQGLKALKVLPGPAGGLVTAVMGAPNVYAAWKESPLKGLVETTFWAAGIGASFFPGGSFGVEFVREVYNKSVSNEYKAMPSLFEVTAENIRAVSTDTPADTKKTDRVLPAGTGIH